LFDSCTVELYPVKSITFRGYSISCNKSSVTAFRLTSDSITVGQRGEILKPFSITKNTDYYYCTDTIVGWQCVFMSLPFFELIIESLRYCQSEKGLRIHGYVIMPNHLHSIISAANKNLSDIIRDFKRFTSCKISDLLEETGNNRLMKYFSTAAERVGRGNDYKIWQSGSHPEAIVSYDFFLQKLNYIHNNPIRKGFVEQPEHWMFSSARNYILDDHSIIKIDSVM